MCSVIILDINSESIFLSAIMTSVKKWKNIMFNPYTDGTLSEQVGKSIISTNKGCKLDENKSTIRCENQTLYAKYIMEKDEAEEGSDGSREKLLGDSQPDESTKDENDPDEEHEDEDIAKLMGFQDAETDDGPWVSASESSFKTREEIDMKLIRPVILRPQSEEVYINTTPPTVTSYRPLPTAILKRQAKMQKMYAKHSSQTSKIVCGILCIFIILGIGAVLLLLARMKKMNDLYIIGGIFACGGVLFTISFIILRCSEDKRLAVTDYSALYKSPVE